MMAAVTEDCARAKPTATAAGGSQPFAERFITFQLWAMFFDFLSHLVVCASPLCSFSKGAIEEPAAEGLRESAPGRTICRRRITSSSHSPVVQVVNALLAAQAHQTPSRSLWQAVRCPIQRSCLILHKQLFLDFDLSKGLLNSSHG